MNICIKFNLHTKVYCGDFNHEAITGFISKEFGFDPEEYEIMESTPSLKQPQRFKSLKDFCQGSISKQIELKLNPNNSSTKIPNKTLKKILYTQVKSIQTYANLNAKEVFQLASRLPGNLFAYPYFNALNDLNMRLRTEGGLPFLKREINWDYYRQNVAVRHLIFQLCGFQPQVDNKKIPLADDFLINYLVTPEDLDACESYIIERMEYRVSDNCAWIKELKESLTTTHR